MRALLPRCLRFRLWFEQSRTISYALRLCTPSKLVFELKIAYRISDPEKKVCYLLLLEEIVLDTVQWKTSATAADQEQSRAEQSGAE